MFESVRPIKSRVVTFDHRPSDVELGADLGYGLSGSSNRRLIEDDRHLKYQPEPISLVFCAICLAIPVFGFLAYLLYFGIQDRAAWAGFILGIFILPFMLAFLVWLNKADGEKPFLVFDKVSGVIELPRLSMSFAQDQVREVVFLERFVESNIYWQVALLLEEATDLWKYVHLYNDAGDPHGWGSIGRSTEEKIADAMDVELRVLRFSKKESAKNWPRSFPPPIAN